MKEEIKAVANASEEGFKTAGKIVDAGREAGGFLGRLLKEPLQESVGIWTDNIRYRRWENALNIESRAVKKIESLGNRYKFRALPLSVSLPLVDAISLEETDDLQELWANLTVNLTNEVESINLGKSFVAVLKEISYLDAKIIEVVYKNPESQGRCILTANLPDRLDFLEKEESSRHDPPADVKLALSNLFRQKCLETAKYMGGPDVYSAIYTTPFGAALYSAISFNNPTV